jgi:DNA processing protein
LAALGFIIVSGMALGIDSAAHEGALAAEGKTVAILGSGIDVIYPIENKALYEKIAKNNNILSEFPMGRKADKITFPIRNRVIAGMCSHVIVIESDCSGGSMITAHIANEYGRHVMAVPGRADQRMSRGCHNLIRNGVTLVSCMDHILEELAYSRQRLLDFSERDMTDVFASLQDPVERKIATFLKEKGPIILDELSMALEIPIYYLISRLQLLELRHVIQKNREGLYEYCGN